MSRIHRQDVPFTGSKDAAAELFGRIASLAVLIVDVIAMRDVDSESVMDSVECIASRIGAIADTAAKAGGITPAFGSADDWCFSHREQDAIAVLRAAGSQVLAAKLARGVDA